VPLVLALVAAVAAALLVRSLLRSRSAVGRRSVVFFDPDRVAHYEAAGWKAYYDRAWLRLLRLIVGLCQEQFRIPFPRSLQAAYYVTRAAAAWAPVDHDESLVRRYYEQFYRLARRYSGLRFDPARVAELELRYNDIHRRLVGNPDKREFVRVMRDLHSAMFDISPRRALPSARWRVLANNAVDRITSKRSADPKADWARLEDYLRRCYRSIQRELHSSPSPH
jgi:hypothetical protein